MMPKIPLNTSYLRPPERISNVRELCTINSIYTAYSQWRNVTIWCPPAHFLPPPTNFLLSPKKKEKKKKDRHFFSVFLIGFLPPGAFCTPKYFFRVDQTLKLAEIWYILLLCQKIFRLKNCKFGNMPPP